MGLTDQLSRVNKPREGIVKRRRLKLAREVVRQLSGAALGPVRGGRDVSIPSVAPHACETAATDGNNGCLSEATGCHTGWTGCGTC